MKTLVVYYSLTGKSKLIADSMARKLDAEVRQLEEVKKRSFLGAYITGARAAMKGKCSDLKPTDLSTDCNDLIFIGSPTWASSPVPAVNSFIAQADLKDKNVVVFASMLGGGGDKAVEKMRAAVEAKGGKVIDSIVFKTGGVKREDIPKLGEEFADKHK